MNKILVLLFTVVGLTAFSQTKTVAGVKFATTTKVNGKTLNMNGGGLREKYWIDLYVAALYVENKTTDAGKIIYADDEQAIHIKIISGSVTRDRFVESVKEGFSNANHGKATSEQIKKFIGFFNEDINYHAWCFVIVCLRMLPLVSVLPQTGHSTFSLLYSLFLAMSASLFAS
jgi:hypothetical protein